MNEEPTVNTTTITPDLLRGALDHEYTERGLVVHRLPAWARSQVPDAQLASAETQPAGVRLAFRTTARVVELDAVRTKRNFVGLPPRPDGFYDLFSNGVFTHSSPSNGGDVVTIDMATGGVEVSAGTVGTMKFALDPGVKDVEIWLPHNETVELVSLRSDSPIEPSPTPSRPRWLHYGSSISQGSNAATPSATWIGAVASSSRLDVVNLGFGGSAMLDPFVSRVLRDEAADVISLEIGINIVNSDAMRLRAFVPAVHGFLDTVRDGHPDVPIYVISPIYCPIHEDTPGPGAFDPEELAEGRVAFMATGVAGPGKLTLRVIREELDRIVAQRQDLNLVYVDGLDLYGVDDFADAPLPDRLHPDEATHQLIAHRFREVSATSSNSYFD